MTNRTLALITGASSGIGAAYARRLAPDHDLVLVARRADRLQSLLSELSGHGGSREILVADLSTTEGIDAVSERLGHGDVRLLVNNAGADQPPSAIDAIDPAQITALLNLNTIAPIQLTRAALPAMRDAEYGSIINVASLLAFSAGIDIPQIPPRSLYAATKAAAVTFSRTLAVELAGTGILVQVVFPGVTATEFSGGYAHEVPFAMTADGVAGASLAGLHLKETFCVPGLEEQTEFIAALLEAETSLLQGGNRPVPAGRYRIA